MGVRPASVIIASTMLLLACTSQLPATAPDPSPPPASTAPADPFTAARTAPDAPEEIRAAAGVISCGDVVLALGKALPRESTECLERSMGAARAELAVAQHTDEGDPVVTFYLTSPGSTGYDVVVDQRQDSFSSRGFARYRCAGATTLDDPASGCAER